MTDTTGKILWASEYTPFGQAAGSFGTYDFKGLFTDKDFDEEIGLYYYNARWYDPNLGRFITEDPARSGNDWYAYALNNPLRYTDPSGLDKTFYDSEGK